MKKNTLQDLKAEHDPKTIITGLRAELAEARSYQVSADMLREFVGTAHRALDELQLPKWLCAPKTAKSPGVPTLMLSDMHWGERVRREQVGGVNAFNLTIAHRRLRQVIETAIYLARILDPEMRYPGICIPLGGDMVSGNIHDELAATNELNTMPTLLDLYGELVPAIKLMADTFGRVFLPCVSGNHDRDTKKTWNKDRNHTSFGWLLYQFLAVAFKDDTRIQFFIPDNADARYRIFDLRYLLTHGDQFRGGDGIIGAIGPITRGDQKKLARYSAVGQEYDIMAFGHWHQRMLSTRLRGNGCLKGFDEYAAQNNFRFERPSQNFWMTHPDHGITFDAPVYCDIVKKHKQFRPWVSIPSSVRGIAA